MNIKNIVISIKDNGLKLSWYKLQRRFFNKKIPAYLLSEPRKRELKVLKNNDSFIHIKCLVIIDFSDTDKIASNILDSIKHQFGCYFRVCLILNNSIDQNYVNYYSDIDFIDSIVVDKNTQINTFINEIKFCQEYDYVLMCNSYSWLHEDALFQFVNFAETENFDVVYSDEDIMDSDGKRNNEHFKPDYNISLLMSCNYAGSCVLCKPSAILSIQQYNFDFNMSLLSYSILLNCYIDGFKVGHLPRLLVHYCKDTSVFQSGLQLYNLDEASIIVGTILKQKLNIEKVLVDNKNYGTLRTFYKEIDKQLVSIIIPNMDHVNDLQKCISSIQKNDYSNKEIIVVENNSKNNSTFDYYENLQKQYSNVKVVYWEGKGFNYPKLINYGAEHADGDLLLLLNNDVEFVNNDAIYEMVNTVSIKDVGCVGAKLLFDDNTIQHAGVTIGIRGVAGHMFYGFPAQEPGYFARAICTQDLSCVTAACMMVKRSVFDLVNGFNPEFVVDFNDVDFCLKVINSGYRIVLNPYVQLFHYESKSRGNVDNENNQEQHAMDTDTFHRKWDWFVRKGDPSYNINLTLDDTDFQKKYL